MNNPALFDRLVQGNEQYTAQRPCLGDTSPEIRADTAENGQHPYAVVVTCSDSRVIPEVLFSAGIGELFVIRVAGNVLGEHELGSIEYAAAHLGCRVIVLLGHTSCGAVAAALSGGGEGYIKSLTDEILHAIGDEHDPEKASCLNALHAAETVKKAFAGHEEIPMDKTDVLPALYDVRTGKVRWL